MLLALLLAAQAPASPAPPAPPADEAPPAAPVGFAQGLGPFLAEHCATCHGEDEPKGGFDVRPWLEDASRFDPASHGEALERVRTRLLLSEMPPAGRRAPPAGEVDRALDWIESVRPRGAERGPSLRRMNARQYERAVRDLFGVVYDARGEFPPDDVGLAFDNDAAVAGASDLAVERWIEAAERVARLALPSREPSSRREFGPAELETDGKVTRRDSGHAMFSAGAVSARCSLPRPGRYRIEVVAWGDRAGKELPRLALEVDEAKVAALDVRGLRGKPETLETTATIDGGEHVISARFVNDFYDEKNPDPKERDRNAYVSRIVVVGPLDPPPETAFTRFVEQEMARGIWGDTPGDIPWYLFQDAVAAVGLRVWRRPLQQGELHRLVALCPEGDPRFDDPEERMRLALTAMLASPNFVYRPERTTDFGLLSPYEVATRLSFFLWSSVPDAELLASAAAGRLADDAGLEREVRRMLRDARSRALAEDFAAQWLGWRALATATPDRAAFPGADEALLDSMRAESEAFFEAVLREERPVRELIDADFAFVDARLARHYGIPGTFGEKLERVRVEDGRRGGLLRQASILTATSNPTRTSPVKRGKWILETLLGSSVPPPPPGVGVLEDSAAAAREASLRERLELHRSKAECAACHARLDPLGFALEAFDGVGRERTDDGGRPLETSGVLPDGTRLGGIADLETRLLADSAFPRALARALFSYAMGRAPERDEIRRLSAAVDALEDERRTLPALIGIVVREPAFRRTVSR